MLAKILAIIGLVSAGLLLIIITTVTPTQAGAFGIFAIFLLSYVALLALLTYGIWVLSRVVDKLGRDFHIINKSNPMTFKKSYYYSTVIALGPVITISLQSVGSVGVYDLGLVGVFIILGCIYVSRRTA